MENNPNYGQPMQPPAEVYLNQRFPDKPHGPLKKIFLLILVLVIAIPVIYFLSKQFNLLQRVNTAKNFELVESSPEDQEGSFPTVGEPSLVFSKKIGVSDADLNKYIQISPNVAGSWHKEKNGQVVYFSSDKKQGGNLPDTFSYNTIYTITVNKDLYSSNNQRLISEINIIFRTRQNPKFGIEPSKKLYITKLDKPLFVTFDKIYRSQDNDDNSPSLSPMKVTVQPASDDDLMQYFKYKKKGYPVYQSPLVSQAKTVDAKLDYINKNYQLGIGPSLLPKTGLYFITISNDAGSGSFFVAVSNHINQVFDDKKNTSVWVSDLSGKSLDGVSANFYSDEGSPVLLDQITTGADGLGKSVKSPEKVDFVITHIGSDMAISFIHNQGFLDRWMENGNYQVFSYTDRPIFKPGDTAHYKAVIRKKENGVYVVPTDKFYSQIVYNYDQKADYKEVNIDQNGTITLDVSLPQAATGMEAAVRLSVKNNDGTYREIESLPITIQAYKKPDMDIDASSTEKEYISSDSAHMKVKAKTNFGQPLSNVDFSFRVLVSDYGEIKDRSKEDIASEASPYYGEGKELQTGRGRFDSKGVADISFSTSLPFNLEFSQVTTLEVTPIIGASPSIGRIQKLIHRGEFAIFIDDLTGDIEKGITGTVSVLDHNIPRRPVAGQPLKVSIYKIANYQNKTFVKSQDLTVDTTGTAQFLFDHLDEGLYEIVAESPDSRSNIVKVKSQIYIGQKPTYSSDNSPYKINLKNDRTSYKIGDTANITVTANFAITDAVAVIADPSGDTYRSSIISIEKHSINSRSFVLQVPVNEQFAQSFGLYIYSANDGFVTWGHTDLTVDKAKKEIDTKISFDKDSYKPGDNVLVTIETKDGQGNPVSADNSLAVIDASILQIGYQSSDIYNRFYGYTPTSYISHHDSTTGIFNSLGQAGGGGGGSGNAGPRQEFVDTAYWNPNIQTDANGKATVTFKLPDNVTTFTATTISNTKDSHFGKASNEFVAKKDFNIIPVVSNFYYQGDKPVISAIIQNASGQDVDISSSLSIKEIGFSKPMSLHIAKDEFATANFAMDVPLQKNSLSFLLEVKDGSGVLLDSVLIKRPILPAKNINSSWQSFQGSRNISFKPTFDSLDLNSLDLWVVPNIASKIFSEYFYIDKTPSVSAGKDLYAYSYLLANTRDGLISPSSYPYAKLKNDFRERAFNLLDIKRATGIWPLPKYQTNESLVSINLWMINGFQQALNQNLLDQVSDLSSQLSNTKQYFSTIVTTQQSEGEQLIRQWVLNQPATQSIQQNPQYLAVSLLGGDSTALDKLRKTSLKSADDRYIWDGVGTESQVLPAIAFIEKGTMEDADKAVKGLSFASSNDPLAIVAGIEYAKKKNLYIDKPSIKVSVNNLPIYKTDDKYRYNIFSQRFNPKNSKDGKVTVNVETKGDLPIYSTVVTRNYQDFTTGDDNLLTKIGDLFDRKSKPLLVDLNLTRTYKDLHTGGGVENIEVGQPGVVVLSADNGYKKHTSDGQNSSRIYSFLVTDAISPAFIYLNQSSGNSPQYQSALDQLLLSDVQYEKSYIPAYDYSEQAVFFDNDILSSGDRLTMPYVVYNASGGSYYQPKTSIVFPFLGVISNER